MNSEVIAILLTDVWQDIVPGSFETSYRRWSDEEQTVWFSCTTADGMESLTGPAASLKAVSLDRP